MDTKELVILIKEMAKKAFESKARDAEKLVIKNIMKNQNTPENDSESSSFSPMDRSRAERISGFVFDHVKAPISGEGLNTYDTSAKGAASEVRKGLGIEGSGRHVEDTVISHGGHHYLIDMKMGPRGSGANLSAVRINKNDKSENDGIYNPEKPVPARMSRIPKQGEETKPEVVQRLSDHFNSVTHGERENIVKRAMNVHDKRDPNVTRLQVSDSSNGTEIHNSDHIWDHFVNHFQPDRYSSETSGNTKKVFAHNQKGDKIHLYSLNVKHARATGNDLNYNIKHYLAHNLKKLPNSYEQKLPESSVRLAH